MTKLDFESSAITAKRESKHIDFKESINLEQNRDWCEIIKDIAAMANSGGGCILFGVTNDGDPSDWNVDPILNLDPAHITDKINKYSGDQFSDFEIKPLIRNRKKIAAMIIAHSQHPIIFIRPGTYETTRGKQDYVFAQGTIYFRHGAKSEPGNSKDLMECIDRKVGEIRKSWMGNIRKVVQAPRGYEVKVLPPNIIESADPSAIPIQITDDPHASAYQKLNLNQAPQGHEVKVLPPNVIESADPSAIPIRITDDPHAPAYQKLNPNLTHPHRQKEVIAIFNQNADGRIRINSFDVQCIRKIYQIDNEHSEFYYKPKFASPQYSDEFVNWLLQNSERDSMFFENAKDEIRKELKN